MPTDTKNKSTKPKTIPNIICESISTDPHIIMEKRSEGWILHGTAKGVALKPLIATAQMGEVPAGAGREGAVSTRNQQRND